MRKYPTLYRLNDLQRTIRETATMVDDCYVPSRPMGLASIQIRIRCAYAVITGRADAVVWPEDEWSDAGSKARAALSAAKGERDGCE